jgi:ubiquinone/menaquinone biosynthesis C-methylase UbiE
MAERTAANTADFFLPHLRPGMSLLDCGCGAGTITIGLAQAVTPGEVVGVDHEPAQFEQARALAAEHGVDNVRFETADLFTLPFADDGFDAAFAHAVLMHVGDRKAALREMRRVVRPGGVVAVKDLRTEDRSSNRRRRCCASSVNSWIVLAPYTVFRSPAPSYTEH